MDQWFSYVSNPWDYDTDYAGSIGTDWSSSDKIDGCLFASGATPGFDGDECTVVLLADQADGEGYFAVLSSRVEADGSTYLDQPGADGAGNGGPIVLQPIPKPFITDTRFVDQDAVLLVSTAAPVLPEESILLQSPDCDSGVLAGYRIYAWKNDLGVAPPVDRGHPPGHHQDG